ncbi:MAG: hypothetical protein WCE75_07470 [Terracidiphilus sp.]
MGKVRDTLGKLLAMLLMSMGVSSPARKPRPAAKPAPGVQNGPGSNPR